MEFNDQELPGGWSKATVGQVFKIVGGGTPSTKIKEYWDGKIPWITSADIHGLKNIMPRKKITKAAIENSATNFVPAGSIIVVTRVSLGKIALTDFPLCFSQDSHALIGNNSLVDIEFALYFLSLAVQGFKHQARGTTIEGVTTKQLSELPILLPPKKEQERIVSRIKELVQYSKYAQDALDKIPPMMKKFRQGILDYAFQGRLAPSDPGDDPMDVKTLPKIRRETGRPASTVVRPGKKVLSIGMPQMPTPSKTWKWIRLLDVTYLASGHTPSRKHPEYWEGTIPWVTAADARLHDGGTIYDTKEHTNALGIENSAAELLPENTVCLSRSASIGTVVMLGKPMATHQGFVNFICGSQLLPKFLLYIFLYERASLFGYTEGSAYRNFYFPEAKAFHVCLPPVKEQQKIVDKIEDSFTTAAKIEKLLQFAKKKVDDIEQSILAKAFRGELVPQDPKDEPASVLLDRIKKSQIA